MGGKSFVVVLCEYYIISVFRSASKANTRVNLLSFCHHTQDRYVKLSVPVLPLIFRFSYCLPFGLLDCTELSLLPITV